MINRIIKGRGFRGLLDYVSKGPLIGGTMEGGSPRELAREFGFVRHQRPGMSRAVFHLVLSLPPGERLATSDWSEIAARVMNGLGYDNAPWAVFLHEDTANQHIHVVGSRVCYDGSYVREGNDFSRAMNLCREIERDWGLRVVASRESVEVPASHRELRSLGSSGEPSTRKHLQTTIRQLARRSRSLDVFLRSLEDRHIQVLVHLTATGQATGVTFRAGSLVFKGSSLGNEFSWRGLTSKLGLEYDPSRDLQILLDARYRFLASSPSRSTQLRRNEDRFMADLLEFPGRFTLPDVTRIQVEHQLQALGSRFEILLVRADTNQLRHFADKSMEDILSQLPFVKRSNAERHEILVRPMGEEAFTVVSATTRQALARAKAAGYEPRLVLRTPSGAREAWFAHNGRLTAEGRGAFEKKLLETLKVGRLAAPDGAGHLAGFTSPIAQRELGLAQPPFQTLEEVSGHRFEAFEKMRSTTNESVSRVLPLSERLERAIMPQVEAALAHDPMVGPVSPGSTSHADIDHAVIQTSLRREDYARLEAEVAHVGPATETALEERLITAFRAMREAEWRLADLVRLPSLPPEMSLDDIRSLAMLRAEVSQAEERLEPARRTLGDGPLAHQDVPTLETLRDDLARLERRHLASRSLETQMGPAQVLGLGRPVQGSRETPSLTGDPRETTATPATAANEATPILSAADSAAGASEFRDRFSRLLGLETGELTLRRQVNLLSRELDASQERLASHEELSRARPTEATLQSYSAALQDVSTLEHRLERLRDQLGSLEIARTRRDVARFEVIVDADPSEKNQARYAELIHRKQELDSTRHGLPPPIAPPPDYVADSRAAFLRHGHGLSKPHGRGPIENVRQALERLYRERILSARAGLRREIRAARRELRHSLSELSRSARPASLGPASEQVLLRWQRALTRYHQAETALSLATPTAPPRGGRLGPLLQRVRNGDLTPETLNRLHRECELAALEASGRTLRPTADSQKATTVFEAVSVNRADRAALLRSVRELQGRGGATAPALDRLLAVLDRYQQSARLASELTQNYSAARFALPVSSILNHSAYRREPHRAVAAWAAIQASRNVPGPQAAEILTRAVRPRTATPRMFSTRFATLACVTAANAARSFVQGMIRDYVHGR